MKVISSVGTPLGVSWTLTVIFPKKTLPTCVVVMWVTSPRTITSESATAHGSESMGPSASQALYLTREAGDNTHFSAQGGAEMAGLVVQGVRELNLPLVSYLR